MNDTKEKEVIELVIESFKDEDYQYESLIEWIEDWETNNLSDCIFHK
jgi:hypothetical protein